MPNTIRGKVTWLGGVEESHGSDGNVIRKRRMILDCTRHDPYTGERSRYENTPMLEFSGDRGLKEAERASVGDMVVIAFEVTGRKYTNREGKESYFTGIRPYGLVVTKTAATPAAGTMRGGAHDEEEDDGLPW